MQHFLKATSGVARARIVPAKFLDKFFPAVDDAETSLDVSFGREPLAAFAAGFVEKKLLFTAVSPFQMDLPVTSRKVSCQ